MTQSNNIMVYRATKIATDITETVRNKGWDSDDLDGAISLAFSSLLANLDNWLAANGLTYRQVQEAVDNNYEGSVKGQDIKAIVEVHDYLTNVIRNADINGSH